MRVTPELRDVRKWIYGKALILGVNLQYSKRNVKAHQQGQYDALKELWEYCDFESDEWKAEVNRPEATDSTESAKAVKGLKGNHQ